MFRPLSRSHHQGVRYPWELQSHCIDLLECCYVYVFASRYDSCGVLSTPQLSYRDVNTYRIHNNILTDQYNGLVTLKDFELPGDGFDWGAETCWSDWSVINYPELTCAFRWFIFVFIYLFIYLLIYIYYLFIYVLIYLNVSMGIISVVQVSMSKRSEQKGWWSHSTHTATPSTTTSKHSGLQSLPDFWWFVFVQTATRSQRYNVRAAQPPQRQHNCYIIRRLRLEVCTYQIWEFCQTQPEAYKPYHEVWVTHTRRQLDLLN